MACHLGTSRARAPTWRFLCPNPPPEGTRLRINHSPVDIHRPRNPDPRPAVTRRPHPDTPRHPPTHHHPDRPPVATSRRPLRDMPRRPRAPRATRHLPRPAATRRPRPDTSLRPRPGTEHRGHHPPIPRRPARRLKPVLRRLEGRDQRLDHHRRRHRAVDLQLLRLAVGQRLATAATAPARVPVRGTSTGGSPPSAAWRSR